MAGDETPHEFDSQLYVEGCYPVLLDQGVQARPGQGYLFLEVVRADVVRLVEGLEDGEGEVTGVEAVGDGVGVAWLRAPLSRTLMLATRRMWAAVFMLPALTALSRWLRRILHSC